MEEQFRGSGRLLGYRAMHQRLTNDYHFVVTRDVVRRMLRILDPEGVEARSRDTSYADEATTQRGPIIYGT